MKFSARLVTLAEVFFIGAITYFVYTLWRGGKVMSNLEKEMPPVMQLHTSMEECKDTFCLHLLSRVERMQYDECYNRSVSAKSSNKFGPIREGTCHFQDGIARFSVGLGSFQGSGNTWLRGLLEKVTGICTGSLYCDGALRTKGFTGEGVHGQSVIAIKSHTVNPLFTGMDQLPRRVPSKTPVFGAALVLIRNPRNSMIAEWHRERTKRQTNRNASNHILFVGEKYFGNNPEWDKYVVRMTDRWKRHVCGWLLNGKNNPLHIVKFEELQENTLMEMSKVLAFYGGLSAAIASKVKVEYDRFHRNHTDMFHHFTVAQDGYVVNAIEEVIDTLIGHYNTDSYIIEVLQSYIISEP